MRTYRFGDPADGIGVVFEPEVVEIGDVRREPGLAVAHTVQRDTAEAEGEEERDLVAPSEGKVRPAVDEDYGGFVLAVRGQEVEVLWWRQLE